MTKMSPKVLHSKREDESLHMHLHEATLCSDIILVESNVGS